VFLGRNPRDQESASNIFVGVDRLRNIDVGLSSHGGGPRCPRADKNVACIMPTHKNVDRVDARVREAQRLSTLLDVSQALSGTLNLKASLHRVLEILAGEYGAVRGLISLVDDTGEVRVEAADGVADAARPVRYQLGEGITGRAVESANRSSCRG
jgi:hypothetical protein